MIRKGCNCSESFLFRLRPISTRCLWRYTEGERPQLAMVPAEVPRKIPGTQVRILARKPKRLCDLRLQRMQDRTSSKSASPAT